MSHKYREGDEPVPNSGYHLTEFLGRGGFGEVWKASSPGGAEAALKIISLGGTEGRKEFRALQLVKRIRHTHLVPIFAFWLKNADGQIMDDALVGQTEIPMKETPSPSLSETLVAPPPLNRSQATELIIAMGLGDKSLFDRLHECQAEGLHGIPQDELLHHMEDAAEAIDFLNSSIHDLGAGRAAIQHCDIKPHNLMIVGGGTQVCDFGLARMMGADRTTTAAATLAYAAPECLVSGKPSTTTDQYSLAVTYFELKTGSLPYTEETLAAVMEAKQQGKLDFSRLSPTERAVLRRATSPNPNDRYRTALEMVLALRQAATELSPTVEFTPTKSKSPPRRAPVLLKVVAPLVLLGIVGYFGLVQSGFWREKPTVRPKNNIGKNEASANNTISIPPATTNSANGAENDTSKSQPPLTPDLAMVAFERAEQFAANGDWAQAVSAYSDALRENPKLAPAYLGRGRCYLKIGPINYDKALDDFKKAKQYGGEQSVINAELAQVYLDRGTEYLKSNRFDEAIVDLQLACDNVPRDFRAFSRLGYAWYSKKEWQKSVDAFTSAIDIEPSDQDYVSRGRAYVKLSQQKNASEDFEQAIAINPQNATANFNLGSVYLDLKEPAKAVAAFGKAIDTYSQSPDAGDDLARAYFSRGCAYLEIESESNNPAPDTANYQKAVTDFDRAASLFGMGDISSLKEIHDLRASCYEALKRPELAKFDRRLEAALKKVEQSPDDADASNTVAFLLAAAPYQEMRNGKQAIAFATKACETSGWKTPEFLDTIAAAYAEDGQFSEAIRWSKKAVELAEQASDEAAAKRYRTQLENYEAGKPNRIDAKSLDSD